MVISLFLGFMVAYVLIELWLTIAFFTYKNHILPEPEEWPEISVLVAARNEEDNIAQCLEALCNLDYPKEKVHILVGNDESTDNTAAIAKTFMLQNPQIQIIDIKDDERGLKAKARVMAQLDPYAKGEFYLVTDADVQVKPAWAKHLIRHMKPETGVASGTTMVQGKGMFNSLQGIDWAHFMGMLNMISYTGVPATAVGNNMIIRKKAYWDTGGYGAIRFSITEDYKLYSEVCKYGWKWDNIMTPEVLAYSKPTIGFFPLLHQRKRWLSGGKELPFYWWILFGVFALYYITLPVLLFMSPAIALVFLGVKMMLQFLSINRIHNLLGESTPSPLKHMIYEAYLFLVTWSTALFFILPVPTIWKGRKY